MRLPLILLALIAAAPAAAQTAGPIGRVSVTNLPANQPVTVTNLPASQPVTITAPVPVTDNAGSLTVDGTVNVGTLPAITGTVAVSNFPAAQAVTGTFWPTTQPVSGAVSITGTPSVTVGNFPTTQPVSGTVAVSNASLPVTQSGAWSVGITGTPAVTVGNFPASQAVTGTVAVSNLPATQAVSGTVAVSNLPTTQTVAGTVAVSNFPATQAVSLASAPLATGGSTIATGQVALSTTVPVTVVAARTGRRTVTMTPTATLTYYVGPCSPTLTTANSFVVLAGGSLTLPTQTTLCALGATAGTLTFVEVY